MRSNSQGSLTDLLKRKRGAEPIEGEEDVKEELKAFSRSKRVLRSPVKLDEAQKMDRQIQTIIERLTELKQDIKEVKESNEEIKLDLRKRSEEWQREKQEMQTQIDSFKAELGQIKEKEAARDKRERKKNIVVTGHYGREDDLPKQFEIFCEEKLGIQAKVKTARVIAKNKNDEPLVLIRMQNVEDKVKIMKVKGKLREKNIKVYIDDDMSKEERELQKRIRKWVQEERGKGRQVQAGFKKVKINGEWIRWEEVDQARKE